MALSHNSFRVEQVGTVMANGDLVAAKRHFVGHEARPNPIKGRGRSDAD